MLSNMSHALRYVSWSCVWGVVCCGWFPFRLPTSDPFFSRWRDTISRLQAWDGAGSDSPVRSGPVRAARAGPTERKNIEIPNPARDSGWRTRWQHGNLEGPTGSGTRRDRASRPTNPTHVALDHLWAFGGSGVGRLAFGLGLWARRRPVLLLPSLSLERLSSAWAWQ